MPYIERIVNLYHNNYFTFTNTIMSLGTLIGFAILHLRNMEMSKQTKNQYNIFTKNNQFDNFLEATKMLTDKDATNEAKISALYLLYDVAQNHPENLDRIIQVINKKIVPLMLCINDGCKNSKYARVLSGEKTLMYLKSNFKIKEFEYIKKQKINIDINDAKNNRITINKWQYNGNETEEIIATALYILKRIIINIIQKSKKNAELSNTILFDIDTDFDKNLKFISEEKPTTNLVFLNCNLQKVDFEKTKYHTCQFIHCNLEKSNFTDANLWGSSFIKCHLKGVNFNKAECEGVEFKKCFNLTENQCNSMTFRNKDKDKDYLFIYEGSENEIMAKKYFKDKEAYTNWKNSSDAT